MTYIKLFIISLVVLVVVVTCISLLIPSHVRVSRATTIVAPKEAVMARLSDPSRWHEWYPMKDSMKILMKDGKANGIGTGNGQGLVITKVTDTSVLASGMGSGKKAETGWNVLPGSAPNSVSVQWYTDFYLGWYPWNKFSGLLLDRSHGPMMEEGLTNLKKLVEARP